MSKLIRVFSIMLLSLFFTTAAFAHQLSTGYITLNSNNTAQYSGNWEINVADLEHVIALDLDQNANITWAEIKAKRVAINTFIKNNLIAEQNTQTCALTVNNNYQLNEHFNQPYLVLPVSFSCLKNDPITLKYSAFFQDDANHKVIVNVDDIARVFSINEPNQTFNTKQSSYLDTFTEYVYQGVLHIWIGIDHILFLIALLLTCVLTRDKNTWQAIGSKQHIIKHTAWIVTAFTLAHSITLTATALDLISLNTRWVELIIAISVLFAALNNVWPLILRLGWLTFAFGLLHGMGFASVLGELGLSSNYQLMSILAFNLGVEIGQLSILLVALPVLMALRKTTWYVKWLMPAGSIGIAIVALKWSIERF